MTFLRGCIPYNKGKCRSEETKKKISESLKGRYKRNNSPHWKGGRIKTSAGYVKIYKPEHPYADPRGYVFEHRLVLERKLGRYLLPTEQTHHLNHVRNDNREENLMLLENNSKHKSEFHSKGKDNSNYKHGKYVGDWAKRKI